VAVVSTSSAGPAKVDAIRDELESWQRLGSRDLEIQIIAQPESAGERPNSVYAVMSSAVAANRLAIEIKVRHE
jgi:non-canonical (house-cleaning) NTP pyrophosphatase